jgi:polysaccharide export outer membrane protein
MEKFSTISILGEVRNPGSYELKGKFGILDAVAQAGGFNIDADINNVKILRVQDGQQTTTQLRLGDIKKGLETTEIVLKPNDTIFVEKIGKVTVLGEVSRPGTFELKDRLTVLEAIAMAGGFTDVASINSTRIIRAEEGSKKVIRIKVTDITRRGQREKDIELFPGDIIYVPESLF